MEEEVMLNIYHEDVGQMLKFDITFVTKSVRELKLEVEKSHGIPYRHQVLYVSGGQIMDGKVTVGKYQAGTDNNPIWLVDNRCYSLQQPPRAYIPSGPDDAFHDSVENSMMLPPSYETIVTRSQIAMRFHDIGKEEHRICSKLVKDQHFQHQGWLALKCTLEDKGAALEKNMKGFEKVYDDFLQQRAEALDILERFETTNQLIKKIPIPGCLESYASSESEKILRESTRSQLVKRDSSLTSCIDRLDRSHMSGPQSASFVRGIISGASTPDNVSSQDSSDPAQFQLGTSPARIERVLPRQGSKGALDVPVGSPLSVRPKQTTNLLRRESSCSQSPDSPLTVSIPRPSTQENLQRVIKEDTYISENKTMQLLLSPTGSSGQTSPQHQHENEERASSPHRTLSDWIKGNATKDPIEVVKTELEDKFSKLSPALREALLEKCVDTLRTLDNRSMKEFKGLDKRLAGLEQLMIQMKALSDSQSDMAQGFIQNQQRVRVEREQSVLPVMCDSHVKQLQVMVDNHRKIGDIKRRVAAAKQELCGVIHARIRWIMHMEEKLREANQEIVMTQGMIRKLSSYMKTLRQVHSTPSLFAQGVVEGYRRRQFSQRFLAWAGSWAEENGSVYKEEVERRRQFNEHLSGHFLMRMFPGYGEEPPSFATLPPEPFDTRLPQIEEGDIEVIRKEVPELAHLLTIPTEPSIGHIRSVRAGSAQTSPSLTHLPPSTLLPTFSTPATSPVDKDDASSDDIVVLNANGEQGVLTPSPDHTTPPPPPSQKSREQEVSPGVLTQSVEVILSAEGMEEEERVEGAMQIPGSPHPRLMRGQAGEGAGVAESPQPPRSLSLHEDYSYVDDSLRTGSPPFQSFKYTSLPDTSQRPIKSPLATSPDLEDEFETANFTTDFYIEESMPSAMSNSTPDRTIAELQVQLKEKTSVVEEQQSELDTVKAKLTSMQQLLGSLRKGWEEMTSPERVGRLKQDVEELKGQVIQDQTDMKQDLNTLSESVTTLVNRLTEEKEAFEKKVTNLEQEAEVLKHQADDNLRSRDQMLEQSIVTVKGDWQEKLEKVTHELNAQIQELEKLKTEQIEAISNLQSQKNELEEKLRKCVLDLDDKTRLLETAESDKKTVQDSLDSEKEKHLQTESKLAEIEKNFSEIHVKCSQLESQKAQLEEQIVVKEKEFQEYLEKQKEENDKELKEQSDKYTELTEQLEQLQDSSDTKVVELTSKIDELIQEKSDIELQLSELKEELEAKNDEYKQELEKTENMAKSSLLEHEVELDKVRSDLTEELENKDQELQQMQNEVDNKIQEIDKLKVTHEKAKEELMLEFQKQKDDIVKSLRKEKEETWGEKENVIKDELVKLHTDNLELRLQERETELAKLHTETLEEKLKEKELELNKVHEESLELKLKEKETELVKLHTDHLDEKLKEKEAELNKVHSDATEQLIGQHQTAITELETKRDEELKRVLEEQESKRVEELQALRETHEQLLNEKEAETGKTSEAILEAFTQEKEKEARELKESLTFDFHKRITDLRADIDAKDNEIENLKQAVAQHEQNVEKMKESGDIMSLQQHGEIISQMKEAWEEEKTQAVNQALSEVQVQHQADIERLIAKLEKEKEDSFTTMQTSLSAEKQVLFNEALHKAVADKDKVIEELRGAQSSQAESVTALTVQLDTLRQSHSRLEHDITRLKDAEKQAVVSQRSAEQELSRLKSKMQHSVASLGLGAMTSSLINPALMTQSVVPVTESGSAKDRIQHLEMENKQQVDEIGSLRAQLKQGAVRDKVSIHTFREGDMVLLCLDEKYDHYVVFTVGPLLLFLHSDCLDALGLKPAAGKARRSWVLAELVEKEYCQAKKAQNRFKVPIGTKFYRVRCRPCVLPVTSSTKAKDSDKDGASASATETRLTDSHVGHEDGAPGVSAGATSELEASVYMGIPEPKS